MTMPGVPSGGFKTVGQLVGTNDLLYPVGEDCLAIAVDLLSTHVSGAPVVDDQGKFIGFISEFDILGAVESGKDLGKLKVEEIMNKQPIAVHESTTIPEAIKIMRDKHLLNLPVEKNGRVTYSITRHDLLRARIGVGVGIEPLETIPVTKLYILQQIKRTTQANGGAPLRKIQFEAETGIKRYDWFGVYWARWSDALREAGCEQHRVQAATRQQLRHHDGVQNHRGITWTNARSQRTPRRIRGTIKPPSATESHGQTRNTTPFVAASE